MSKGEMSMDQAVKELARARGQYVKEAELCWRQRWRNAGDSNDRRELESSLWLSFMFHPSLLGRSAGMIVAWLYGWPCSERALALATGKDPRTVKSALKRLQEHGLAELVHYERETGWVRGPVTFKEVAEKLNVRAAHTAWLARNGFDKVLSYPEDADQMEEVERQEAAMAQIIQDMFADEIIDDGERGCLN